MSMKMCRKQHQYPDNMSRCPECKRAAHERWRRANPDVIKALSRRYRENNHDRIASWREDHREYMKEWYRANKHKKSNYHRTHRHQINAQRQARWNSDICYRISIGLRVRLNIALKRGYRSGSAVRDLGCTIPGLKQHLESQFQPGMTWENWGKGPDQWQIHHIVPLHTVDLTKREDFLRVNHYTNLQPVWYNDHIALHTIEDNNGNNSSDSN